MTSCYDVQQNQTASFKDIVYRNNNNNDPGSAEERTQFCLLVSSSNIEPDYLSEVYIYAINSFLRRSLFTYCSWLVELLQTSFFSIKVFQPIRRLVVCGKAHTHFCVCSVNCFVAELDRYLLNNRITAGLLSISTLVITFYEFQYKSRR